MAPPARSIRHEELLAQVGWVRRLAASLVGDPNAAEDVAQQTWLLALERPPLRALSGPGLRAWLAAVTRTFARQSVRSERRRTVRESRAARPEAQSSAGDVVQRAALQHRLVAAVMGLGEPYRSAVLLRYFDGLSGPEIARRQGVSPAAARKRLSRGLAELRSRLDGEFGERDAWSRALVPLAGSSSALGPTPGPLPLLLGTLVMHSSVKIAAAALALVGGAWLARSIVADGAVGPEPAGLAAKAPGPAEEPAPVRDVELPLERAAVEAPLAAPIDSSPPALGEVTVSARILDEDGRPIPGTRLELHANPFEVDFGEGGAVSVAAGASTPAEAPSDTTAPGVDCDEQGWARLVLPAQTFVEGRRRIFRGYAAGFGDRYWNHTGPAGARLDLGEARLARVGAVRGIVLDEAGRPIAGATVCAAYPSMPEEIRESMTLWGPGHQKRMRSTKTGPDGSFQLRGIQPGTWRVWAGIERLAWTPSQALRLGEEGRAVEPLELVLRPLPASNRIEGLVLGPDGRPLEGIDVLCAYPDEKQRQFNEFDVTDEHGRFLAAVGRGLVVGLRARDPERRYGLTTVEGVPAGTTDLVLQFREPKTIELLASDEQGLPIQRYKLRVVGVGEAWPLHHGDEARTEGLSRFLRPDCEYTIEVSAKGRAGAELGPFDPDFAPERLSAVLPKLARVRGRVTAEGRPVEGAVVQLVRTVDARRKWMLYGFPSRLDGEDLVGVLSGEDGRFELPIQHTASYSLLAFADGHASAELGPVELGPERDAELELELGPGGALAGRVIPPPGGSPAGAVVRISRGDMRVQERRVGEDGEYLFEHLTPGPWMVKVSGRMELPGEGVMVGFASASSVVDLEQEFVFPWDCEVLAGRTTVHDLDLSEAEECSLSGSLTVDGRVQGLWSVRVHATDKPWHWELFDSEVVSLDLDGRFELGGLQRGETWIVYEPASERFDGLRIVQRSKLGVGANERRLDLSTASLSGDLGSELAGRPLRHIGEPLPGVFVVSPLRPDGQGRFQADPLPAGPGRIVVRGEDDRPEDPTGWQVLHEVLLEPGRAQRLSQVK